MTVPRITSLTWDLVAELTSINLLMRCADRVGYVSPRFPDGFGFPAVVSFTVDVRCSLRPCQPPR
jgi:hypothetical protein